MAALVIAGLALSLVVWTGLSAFVVVNRVLYDRRERRLIDIARALADPSLASLPAPERVPAVARILSRLSRRAVYNMVISTDFPVWVTDTFAAWCLERWGLSRMVSDASPHGQRRKWRRISALFMLGHLRAADAHELLGLAIHDVDPDVANAAAVILHRLGDRRAAGILVSALRKSTLPGSRVATHLEQFPIPIADLLPPLLEDSHTQARYWGASLLRRYPDLPGLASRLAVLTVDPDAGVRKASLAMMGYLRDEVAAFCATRALGDPVAYVRSAAVRALARHALLENDEGRRRGFVVRVAAMMADADWDVRLAAKESLVELGPTMWREVAALLESPDAFARNGAAEVLQNLGVLDWSLRGIANGLTPSAELRNLLAGAFREGGPAMVNAAVERSQPEPLHGVEQLVSNLRFVGEAS